LDIDFGYFHFKVYIGRVIIINSTFPPVKLDAMLDNSSKITIQIGALTQE